MRSLATPIHLADTPLVYRRHPPRLGEHTDEVLAELGYDEASIRAYHERHVIA